MCKSNIKENLFFFDHDDDKNMLQYFPQKLNMQQVSVNAWRKKKLVCNVSLIRAAVTLGRGFVISTNSIKHC